jgi:hypothetical protein
MGKGSKYSPSTLPDEPLVLWGYEPSPFVRLVRERIVELEIPHIFKTTTRGSAKRQEMFDKYGKFQVPFLEVSAPLLSVLPSECMISYFISFSLPSSPVRPRKAMLPVLGAWDLQP